MRLIYYRGQTPNFGDDLNGELWERLAPELFDDPKDLQQGFVGIGTIIGSHAEGLHRLHVFSSGVSNDPVEAWADREVTWWCVRGPVSARKLNLSADAAITDGAVLAPLAPGFPTRAADHRTGVLVIPHFQTLQFGDWRRACDLAGFELVDPRGVPKDVVAKIAAAKVVLTESLHGAIFADLFGVPWHAFTASKNFGVVKWIDWLAGLGRSFELTTIPAPDVRLVLSFGRRPEPFGQRVTFTLDDVEGEYHQRLGGPAVRPSLRKRLKTLAGAMPLAGPLLGYHPARTAEALVKLAAAPARVTEPAILERHRQRLLERLEDVRRAHRAGLLHRSA
jgi:succinoglycan biosynthesis protein ExoV